MKRRPAPSWLTEWEYAHRGLHSEGVPENSLAAAEAAIAAGLGIESDVQRSRDDHPIVFHDWELDRLTNEAGLTESRVADDLEQLSLLGTDQSPVRLVSFLGAIGGRVPILIEIKSRPGYDCEWTALYVARLLESYDSPVAVMSFDPRVSQWFTANAPQVCCGLVMREDEHGYTQTEEERSAALSVAEPDFLAYHVAALAKPKVANMRAAGLPVLTWTVNSAKTRRFALEHADALISEGAGLA